MVPDQISKLDLIQARIDVIPSDWQLCKVAEALKIRNNLRKPISQEVRETIKGNYPYYGPTKVQGYISEYEQDGTYALIGEDGDHFLKYATMPQTQYISGKCTVNNHAHILESSEICDAQWFFNYFKHRDITNFLSRQGAGRFKLNKATLEKLPMLVPPLPEQRKIAKILSTWDKAISTTEKLIETSKQQKKALMQQLLTGKKRLVNHETGKAFDGDWNSQPISSLITESRIAGTNGELARKLTVKLYGRGVTQKEEKRLGSSSTKYYKRKSGQFIYSKLDFLNGAFGIIPEHLDGFESTLDLPAFDFSEAVEPNWFIEFVSRDDFYTSNLGLANGGRKARRVNPKDLLQIKVQVPSLEEQQKIASVLTAADKETKVLEAKLAHFKQEKKALMQQLLTGKRRVKVEEMEVA
ncbi:type I restriction endonuclease subunit S [Vibrio parahaemolyticus]|uniref:restriction endonuclease subunit S n=1 Tax=Vibrio parahaemolyticus TaxID=670 RepID=UPI0011200747|nr:restriction endonuclease subunit S [Vibrio parahaemolyticus]TNZ67737.1 type I restriction endonuclease subunit S [Vibrio parahaemolyticus]